jgi:hypothetical protein
MVNRTHRKMRTAGDCCDADDPVVQSVARVLILVSVPLFHTGRTLFSFSLFAKQVTQMDEWVRPVMTRDVNKLHQQQQR